MFIFSKSNLFFVMFLFLLFYWRTFHLSENFPFAVLPVFNGAENTVFNITFQKSETEIYFVGLANQSYLNSNWNYSYNYNTDACIDPNTAPFTFLNTTLNITENNNWSTVIPFKMKSVPIIISCDSNKTNADVTACFVKDGIFTDLGSINQVFVSPIEICAPLVMIGMIIVSIFCKKKSFYRTIHTFILITCFFSFLKECLALVIHTEIKDTGKVPEIYFYSYNFLDFCFQLFLFLCGYILGCTWSETLTISISKIIRLFLYSLCLIRLTFYEHFYAIKEFIYIPVLVQAFGLFAVTHLIVSSVQNLEFKMLAYDLVIEVHGTKPSTTPLKRKQLVSYVFLIICVIYLILRTVGIFFFIFVDLDKWINDLVAWFFDNALLFGFLLLSFPGYPKKTYNDFFVDENELSNLPTADFDPVRIQNQGTPKDWNDGDILPVLPEVQPIIYHIILEEPHETEEPLLSDEIDV